MMITVCKKGSKKVVVFNTACGVSFSKRAATACDINQFLLAPPDGNVRRDPCR